ncbi:hypothetical protein ACFXOM_13110 [Streptomyces sp. NPDC059169]|uniref:hypothetical protein n=1 Tax=unclassified Streptomyces TaxID=2593676 RepID=UPI0036D10CB3
MSANPAYDAPKSGQLAGVHSTLMGCIGREMCAGHDAVTVSREALDLLDDMEELLGRKVLEYAVRPAE